MVAMVWGTHYRIDILQSDVPPESKEPNPISVRCSDAEIWLIYMIVWLLWVL